MHFPTLIACALASFLVGGCFQTSSGPGGSDGVECVTDDHCPEVCTHTGECVAESNVVDVRIEWTVNGDSVSPTSDAACAGVNMLSVRFVDRRVSPDIVYRPVPCNLGLITYNKMPGRLDSVELSAWDDRDRELARVTSPLTIGDNRIEMNLQP